MRQTTPVNYTSTNVSAKKIRDWVNEITNALFAKKNKIEFIDGSISKPEDGLSTLILWKRCNAMVKGWLNTAMEKKIRNSVKYAKTAEEVWNALDERFG